MDKIKPIIAAVAKHVFWAGCGLILIVSVLTWYMARGRLHKEFDKHLSDIGSKVSAVDQLKQKSHQNPPNQHSHRGMEKLLDSTLQKVVVAWEKQYSYQVNLLRWPSELEDDFVAAVRPLKPIELKVDYPPKQEQKLDLDFRYRYANYVENLLPRLARFVGTEWAPTGAGGGLGGTGALMTPDGRTNATARKPPIVVWEPQDQGRLLGTHFNWGESAPSTLQVLYAQEDLWVLEALVRIIAATNGKIESRHEAVVKTIESIMIGRGVTGRAGQVVRMGGGGGGGVSGNGMEDMGGFGDGGDNMPMDMPMDDGTGFGGELGVGGDMPGGGADTGANPMGASGAILLTADPADGRYVDNNYTPLRASEIRDAVRASNPEKAFLVVAKRMPIRLRLVVDQRKLHRLLAYCGNSSLPVEIRQVRLNRGGSAGGGAAFDMGGGAGMYDDGGSLSGAMGLGGDGGAMSEPSHDEGMMATDTGGGYPSQGGLGTFTPSMEDLRNRTQISSTTSHDVPVELYGIIYIYNPVDQDRLGIKQSQEGLTGPVQPETNAPG
jgi:hypothetical protein